jgi:transposase-like protein
MDFDNEFILQDIQDISQISEDTSQNTSQNTSQDTSQNTFQNSQDISKKQKSEVYNYFTINEDNSRYNCNHCNKSYKVSKDGSTSALRKHLKSKHNDLFLGVDEITIAMNKLEISKQLVYILFYYIFYIV